MKESFKKWLLKIKELLSENRRPQDIALGIAIGVYIGCSPFYGFHTLLAVLVALVLHNTNRLAIILGTQISLPFLAPFIYWVEYKVGKKLLFWDFLVSQRHQDRLLEANHVELGLLSVLVGSVIVGLGAGAVSYALTLLAADRVQRRRATART